VAMGESWGPSMVDAVTVTSIGRTFPGANRGDPPLTALTGVDLAVAAGETHGLLGPNGAGKTTLVKVLCTVLLPTSGAARVLGHDVVRETKAVRKLIGIVFGGDGGLYGRVSARRNLLFWASMYGLGPRAARTRVDELLARVGLDRRSNEPVERYSRGMKQRLHLARGLVGHPKVLFLDEPTVGMDPVASLEFRKLVRELRDEGRTVFLTTHDMAEAEAVCDRISLIDGGRLLLTERTALVGNLLGRGDRIDFSTGEEVLIRSLRERADVASVEAQDGVGRWRLVPVSGTGAGELVKVLVDAGVATLNLSPPSLEEVYLNYIGSRGLTLQAAEEAS
jgi:ABC-2 type transport system ATP-binding protein